MLSELMKLRFFNKLKSVYRLNSVGSRKESAAEHSWSCLVLADFFIGKTSKKLDRLRVYELLMYHDVVEIGAGDSPLHPKFDNLNKKDSELKAAKVIRGKLPPASGRKFWRLFAEFEGQKTVESKFAKAIDALDAEIHELDYKQDWKGWTPEFLSKRKLPYFDGFPELKRAFKELLDYLVKEGYFKK